MYNPDVAIQYETEPPHSGASALGPYRESDYLALPDEPRCELLYGRLVVAPAPTFRHQEIIAALLRRLAAATEGRGCRVVTSPVDIVLADHSVVQPDLVLVSPERAGIIGDRVHGAPDLLVEVLSPSTARRDLGAKMRLYAEAGVAEYWLVDGSARTFEFLVNREGSWLLRLPHDDGVYRSDAVPGLDLDPEAFWAALPG